MYNFENLICTQENNIMVLAINRTKVLNALNSEVISDLGEAFSMMENDSEIDVVIITGNGEKAFIAGSDVSEMANCTPLEARTFALQVNSVQQKIALFPKPTIAAINGFAFGGGLELAMCCDIRIASKKAKLGQPELNVGLIPGGGGTQRLQRIVGVGLAKEMIYTCMTIDAQKALEIGLVNSVVSHENILEAALDLAKKISKQSSVLLKFAKAAIDTGADMDIENALKSEIEIFAQCFGTKDGREGLNAFIEKRKPNFIGK